jgi:hypothetical protein
MINQDRLFDMVVEMTTQVKYLRDQISSNTFN